MVPEDLTRIQFVTDPQIAPDGRRVAFVVTRLSEERDEYLSNIWIVDATGGTPRRFTAGPRRDLEAIRQRYTREVSPGIAQAGWEAYDHYLKANRIEAGTASYAEVVQLILGTGLR